MNTRIYSVLATTILLGSAPAAPAASGHSVGHGMAAVFDMCDRNADGQVDPAELQTYLDRRRLPDRFADLWAFGQIDRDGSGALDLDEWSGALRAEMQRRRSGG